MTDLTEYRLRDALPKFDPNILLPAIMAVGVYPLLMALTESQNVAFTTAFFMGLWVILARHAEWAARYWCKHFSVRTASLLAVCAAMGPATMIVMFDRPDWCLRLFSVFALVASFVLLNDLRDGDHAYMRFRLPDPMARFADPELARAFLTWNMALILLNEGVIALLDINGWMVWYAGLLVLIHGVETAIVIAVLHRRRLMA